MKKKTNSNYSNKRHNSKIKTSSTSKCSKAKRTNKAKSKSNPMMILILIKRNSGPHSKLKITILSNSKSLSFKKYISLYLRKFSDFKPTSICYKPNKNPTPILSSSPQNNNLKLSNLKPISTLPKNSSTKEFSTTVLKVPISMASMKKIKALSKISTKDCQKCWKNKKNSPSSLSKLAMKRTFRAKKDPRLKSTAIKRFINFLLREKNEPSQNFKSLHFKFVYFLIGFRIKKILEKRI